MSAPSEVATQRSSGGESGFSSVPFASRSAVAASELPPPRPAATGIRFTIVARHRGSTPAAPASFSRAARTIVSPAKPVTASVDACAIATRSPRSTLCSTVATSCFPSSRGAPTTSARLIFAGAGALLTALRSKRRTPRARAPLPVPSPAAPQLRARRRLACASRDRRARASSAASCGGARRRHRPRS